jgi:hypothetical protein
LNDFLNVFSLEGKGCGVRAEILLGNSKNQKKKLPKNNLKKVGP